MSKYEDGWTPFPAVLDEDIDRESKVLDSSGIPFKYKKKYEIGFKVKGKTNGDD